MELKIFIDKYKNNRYFKFGKFESWKIYRELIRF